MNLYQNTLDTLINPINLISILISTVNHCWLSCVPCLNFQSSINVRVVTRLSRRCKRHRRQRRGQGRPSGLAWMWIQRRRKPLCLPLQLAGHLRVQHWSLAPCVMWHAFTSHHGEANRASAPNITVSVMLSNSWQKINLRSRSVSKCIREEILWF